MNTLRTTLRATPGRAPRRLWTAAAALAGGGLIMAGTCLPWLTLFAGLHTYPGIMGLWGRLLFAGGALAAAAGMACLLTRHGIAPAACRVMGPVLLSGSVFLLLRQHAAYRELVSTQPMMVPGVGSGLYVVLAGAALVTATLVLGWRRAQSAAPRDF
ncbi:hypothetical protein BH23GEM9_BH23GEM9_03590 [soil metagenome]